MLALQPLYKSPGALIANIRIPGFYKTSFQPPGAPYKAALYRETKEMSNLTYHKIHEN
jgi:hypothetical protein